MTDDVESRAYEAFTSGFGRELDDAAGRRRAARPRARRSLFAAGGVAVAGTAAALVVGIGSGGSLDVVSQAKAALAPGGYIVHVGMTVRTDFGPEVKQAGGGRAVVVPIPYQVWSATDPPRWRSTTDRPVTLEGRRSAAPVVPEVAYGHGAQSNLSTETAPKTGKHKQRLSVVTGFSDHGQAAKVLLPYAVMVSAEHDGVTGGDPLETVRSLLADGTLHDRGRATVDGRTVLRLTGRVVRTTHAGINKKDVKVKQTSSIEYDVDPDTFVPVRMDVHTTPTFPANLPISMPLLNVHTVVDFTTYERLPDTPANAHLLTIQPPAGTKVTRESRQQAVANARRREQNILRGKAPLKSTTATPSKHGG